MSVYRPRGALSRAILEKFQSDAFLQGFDINTLYEMERPPSRYQAQFVPMAMDDKTSQWLEASKSQSEEIMLQIWYIFAKFFLSIFVSQTDLNGLLSRGSMFILSEDQIVELLSRSGFRMPANVQALDIGAGDGHCTKRIQTALSRLDKASGSQTPPMMVTETSWIMRKRLRKFENFQLVEVDQVANLSNVHLVSCLNVLDRCLDPHQMISDIHNILSPDGRALFALVLPYYHYVESSASHLPLKPLMPHWPGPYMGGSVSSCDCSEHHRESNKSRPTFEDEVVIFFELLEEKGFRIDAWTKAPYLCEGDIRQSFYWLTDIVVVASKAPSNSSCVDPGPSHVSTYRRRP